MKFTLPAFGLLIKKGGAGGVDSPLSSLTLTAQYLYRPWGSFLLRDYPEKSYKGEASLAERQFDF